MFTELEWGIRPHLEEWADVTTCDAPGVGSEPLPGNLQADIDRTAEFLPAWREEAADRFLREADRRSWDRFVLVTDSRGTPTAVKVAKRRRGAVRGLAIGHAALSASTEGDRAPERAGIWDAVAQLARQGNEAFVRYGIAQATRGGIDEETAQQMIERFPDMDLVSAMVDALAGNPEPIGDDLHELGIPLLLAKHEGCRRCDPSVLRGSRSVVGDF